MLGVVYLHVIIKNRIAMSNALIFMNVSQNNLKKKIDMNVLITLPKHLIDAIISGKKTFEMRSVKPKLMNVKEDGFFCVEKGTDIVRCWCRCDEVKEVYTNYNGFCGWSDFLCVDREYIFNYCLNKKKVYLWHILKVVEFEDESLCRGSLFVDHNPQQFAYCPLSFGESY